MKSKIIIYTTNLGGYDDLHDAPRHSRNVEYLYYTDGESPKGWEKIEMKDTIEDTSVRRESRYYKINSHLLPPHDISIYIDASYIIKKDIAELVMFLGDRDIALAEHERDNCVYQHAKRVLVLKLDTAGYVKKQVERYKRKGFPKDFGVSENCLIIRKNTQQVRLLNELWWIEYQRGSQRDQLSMPYALWKTGIKVAWLPFSARKNRWLKNWCVHLKSNKII